VYIKCIFNRVRELYNSYLGEYSLSNGSEFPYSFVALAAHNPENIEKAPSTTRALLYF
jgi:hypothetical protein